MTRSVGTGLNPTPVDWIQVCVGAGFILARQAFNIG